MTNNHDSIQFNIKSDSSGNTLSIEFYRPYERENGEVFWSYIDSSHAMSKMELLLLRNFLQEYLHNNDWY